MDTEAEVQRSQQTSAKVALASAGHMGVTGTLIPESMYAVLLERQKKERQEKERQRTHARLGV